MSVNNDLPLSAGMSPRWACGSLAVLPVPVRRTAHILIRDRVSNIRHNLYVLALLRWLGSRTIWQLSTIEFLLVIALGSAVGDAMFYPDVPPIHALLVFTIVVLANKGLDVLIAKSKRAEKAVDGIPEEAVRDGVIRKAFIASTTFSKYELFQQLRKNGVENLGDGACVRGN